ncbi:uncharacterized protein LOC113208284 [Frankliniella occidentalis]|uniref:Uncharacterized protein LOC113208284 n=1 Tax=Frankliniella occidentalis TaxID=133901 RepID=A0A9C6XQE6_FRAOC|nr:uncharacterized protein LOC113208284 [Frankliniella occidentalis]
MDALKCPKCRKEYDKAQHFPKLVIPCAHPICLWCVPLLTARKWKCPTCERSQTRLSVSPPNNISVVQLLDNLQGLSSGTLSFTLRCGDRLLVSHDLSNIRTPSIKALLVSVAARGQLQKSQSAPSTGHTDVMQCPECFKEYNTSNRYPKIVIPCAHPACLKCLWQSQQKCPTCQQEFEGLAKWQPNNMSVMQLLESLHGLCRKPLTLTLRGADGVLLSKDLPNSGDPLIKALLVADGATPATDQSPKQKVKKERKRNQPKDAAVPVHLDSTPSPHNGAASKDISPGKNGHAQTKGAALREVHFESIRLHDRAALREIRGVERLVGVRCDLHPETSLYLLQVAAPSLVELSLVNPNADHLSAVEGMPHLGRLSVRGFDAIRGHIPLISLSRKQLRWLRVRDLQDEALRRLLTAYTPPLSDALEELQLWVNTAPVALQRWETCCNTLLSLVYKLELHKLRKLVLKWGLFYPHDKTDCASVLRSLQEELPETDIQCLDCGTWEAF